MHSSGDRHFGHAGCTLLIAPAVAFLFALELGVVLSYWLPQIGSCLGDLFYENKNAGPKNSIAGPGIWGVAVRGIAGCGAGWLLANNRPPNAPPVFCPPAKQQAGPACFKVLRLAYSLSSGAADENVSFFGAEPLAPRFEITCQLGNR